jgi:hypothetical protein
MRRSLIWIAAASLALVSTAGSAADVEETLQLMQQRMNELEARLDATTDDLEAANERVEQQNELITSSGLAEARGSDSSLGSFADSIEIGGWVAASWFWNFNHPDGGNLGGANAGTTGTFGGSYPFHPDSNSFSLDQLWFEIERPVSEENRAGFRADLVWGKTGGLLSDDTGSDTGLSGDDFDLYQAYVQYLAPVGPGIHFKAGKFQTIIGAEVAQSPYNFNITRGQVYQLFQPFTHTGILGTVEGEMGTSFTVGLVNETRSFPARDIDVNNNKALLWSLAWSGDTVGASFNGAWGDSSAPTNGANRSGDKEQIYDVILNWDPTEDFSSYINFDYRISEVDGPTGLGAPNADQEGYGIAAAGRYAVTDRLGLALRGEYVDLKFDNAEPQNGGDNVNLRYWGVTSTADFALTEALTVRAEVRQEASRPSLFEEVLRPGPAARC